MSIRTHMSLRLTANYFKEKKVRVILINPFDETVKEAVYGGDYREIYDLIECTTFDCVSLTSNEHLYVDDEGLLKDNQRYFRLLASAMDKYLSMDFKK